MAKRISAVEIFAQTLALTLIVNDFLSKLVAQESARRGQQTPDVESVSFIHPVHSVWSVVSSATVPFA